MKLFKDKNKNQHHSRGRIIRLSIIGTAILLVCLLLNCGGGLIALIAEMKLGGILATRVDIKSAEFTAGGKLIINNLSVITDSNGSKNDCPLSVRQAVITIDRSSLLTMRPRVTKIQLTAPAVNLIYNSKAKKFNLGSMRLKLPHKKKRQPIPPVEIINAAVCYRQFDGNDFIDYFLCRIPRLQTAVGSHGSNYDIRLELFDANGINAISQITGKLSLNPESGSIEISGGAAPARTLVMKSLMEISRLGLAVRYDRENIYLEQALLEFGKDTKILLSGEISEYRTKPVFRLRPQVNNINITHRPQPNSFPYENRLFGSFIPLLQMFFDWFYPSGHIDIDVVLEGSFAQINRTKCKGTIFSRDVQLSFILFPYLVTNINGLIDVTEKSMTMKNLTGRHGEVDITMAGYIGGGKGKDMDANIVMSSPNMLLDQDLYNALKIDTDKLETARKYYETVLTGRELEKFRKLWITFTPQGRVSGDFHFFAKPGNPFVLSIDSSVDDVNLICQYFPYPLKHSTGRAYISGETVQLKNIVSRRDNAVIFVDGILSDIGTEPVYDFNIATEKLPVDQELIFALPEKPQDFVRRFEIDATVDSRIKLKTSPDDRTKVDYAADLTINGKSFRHRNYDLTLNDATLTAKVTPQMVVLDSLEGRVRGADVKATGIIRPNTESDKPIEYCLNINARSFPVDPCMSLGGISPAIDEVIRKTQFTGPVDINAVLNQNAAESCGDTEFRIKCLGDSATIEKLPLPLKNLRGDIIALPRIIEFKNITANLDVDVEAADTAPVVRLDGVLHTDETGFTDADLSCSGTDIVFDDRLGDAMGADIAPLYKKLHPAGAFNFNLPVIKMTTEPNIGAIVRAEGNINFINCSLGENKIIDRMNSTVELKTEYSMQKGLGSTRGKLTSSSFRAQNRLITNFVCPFSYDSASGTLATEQFTANCYNGNISGSARIYKPADSAFYIYDAQMGFDKIGAFEFLEVPAEYTQTQGTMGGSAGITGTLGKTGSTGGRVQMIFLNMSRKNQDPLQALSEAIKKTGRKNFLFQNMYIDSYIVGSTLRLDRVDIYGNTLSLRGSGTLDLPTQQANIDFIAYSNSHKTEPSFIESLARSLGPAMLQVQLQGRIEDPQITVETLPALKSPLNIMGGVK